MKFKQGDLLLIEWLDHWGSTGWANPNSIDTEPLVVSSVGWYIKEDKNGVLLAASQARPGSTPYNITGNQLILKKVITKTKKLKT